MHVLAYVCLPYSICMRWRICALAGAEALRAQPEARWVRCICAWWVYMRMVGALYMRIRATYTAHPVARIVMELLVYVVMELLIYVVMELLIYVVMELPMYVVMELRAGAPERLA